MPEMVDSQLVADGNPNTTLTGENYNKSGELKEVKDDLSAHLGTCLLYTSLSRSNGSTATYIILSMKYMQLSPQILLML